jgi:diguanylate cyclase (GGDEF)-like protein
MKKKTGPVAPKVAKRRKSGVGKPKPKPQPKGAPLRVQRGKAPKPLSRALAEPNGARSAIRKLRSELARTLKRIAELEASADTDFLLDIPNRRGFEREFHRAIAYIKRYHASGALIVLDVDRLKPINDAFGHAAGDQVLKAVAATLARQVRSSDVVGRLGGDEFAVLLWNLTETDARAKAASLEEAIDQLTFTFRGRTVTAGASAGVAVLGPHAEAGRALEEADSAMYLRKALRRHES